MEEILKGLYSSWPVVGALAYMGYQMHAYVLATEKRLTKIEEKVEALEENVFPKAGAE